MVIVSYWPRLQSSKDLAGAGACVDKVTHSRTLSGFVLVVGRRP